MRDDVYAAELMDDFFETTDYAGDRGDWRNLDVDETHDLMSTLVQDYVVEAFENYAQSYYALSFREKLALHLRDEEEAHRKAWDTRGRSEATPDRLPDNPSKYFTDVESAELIDVSKLVTIRARPAGIAHAAELMAAAYNEGGGRRKPLDLERQPDGTFKVLDGNSTAALAKKHQWEKVPARVWEPGTWQEPAHLSFREKLHLFALKETKDGEPWSDVVKRAWDTRGRGEHGSRERPAAIKVGTVKEAISHILAGRVVELPNTRTVNTLLHELADMAKDAKAKGKDAPNYDLCKVTVAGTNLFCAEKFRNEDYPDGVPRIEMPQLSGTPEPGSPASKLAKDKSGYVNAAQAFMEYLRDDIGVSVTSESVPAAKLKASQREIVGPKVASIMRSGRDLASTPMFVSRDGYVIDGHHRWAAAVGRDAEDDRLGDLHLSILRVDAPIAEILFTARKWTKKFGIAAEVGLNMSGPWPDDVISLEKTTSTGESWSDVARRAWDTRGRKHDDAAHAGRMKLEAGGRNIARRVDISDATRQRMSEGGDKAELFAYLKEHEPKLVAEIDRLITLGKNEAHGELDSGLKAMSEKLGFKYHTDLDSREILADHSNWVVMAPVKGIERSAIKVATDYDGDVGALKDVVRATIAVDSANDLRDALSGLDEIGELVNLKDSITKPTEAGYRDMKAIVRLRDSRMLAEVQVLLKPMLKAKNGDGHKLYAEMRTLPASTPRYQTLLSQSRALYDSAWAAAGGSAALAAVAAVISHVRVKG